MKNASKGSVVLVIAALSVLAPTNGFAAAPPKKPTAWTPALMMKVKRIGSVRASPDGKQVVFTVRQAVMEGNKSEYLTHIHLFKGRPGLRTSQLTRGEVSSDDPQWSPDGK